ncbi:PREDICTED: folate transporter 1 [Galeopterus variegatus]|uniref:Folate transporter 1 n=1 Tax=Galeopterus variegatus TaxID=482537 RepID=A0ABM0RKG1_GALVR|nr:PREDICTED: folate transporter 1 [Galeopterus variegatus]
MVPSGQAVEKQVPVEAELGHELRSWRCLVFYLCFYGFMAQMRPGESFITPYLLGPDKNFTKEQVTNEITPVLSYSYMVVLVPVFLLTDYLRYKPVLVLQGLSFVSVWLLLLLGRSVLHMQVMELFYSITMAARIAYSSYIFSLVRPARYQRMASYSRAAVLLGVFISSVLGQLLVTAGGISFPTLNYISLAFLLFSLGLALFLKRPKRSLFFNRPAPTPGAAPGELDCMNPAPGAITSFVAGFLQVRWALWSKLVIGGVTALQAGLVFLMYRTHNIWLCYAAFVVFRGSYQFLVPIATFQIASSLSKELCALFFGVNTFFATILKTAITLIVSDKRGLGFPVHSQFLVYFVYLLVLSAIYFLGAMLDGLRHFQQGLHQPLPPAEELRSPMEEKTAQALSVQDGGPGSLQPLALPLPPEDSAWTVEPASREQSQLHESKACLGPDVTDSARPQAAYPGVSKLGFWCCLNSSVQNVNQGLMGPWVPLQRHQVCHGPPALAQRGPPFVPTALKHPVFSLTLPRCWGQYLVMLTPSQPCGLWLPVPCLKETVVGLPVAPTCLHPTGEARGKSCLSLRAGQVAPGQGWEPRFTRPVAKL